MRAVSMLGVLAFGPEEGGGVIGSGVRSILVNGRDLALARLAGQSARLIYVMVVARELGPQLYGQFAFGQSLYLGLLGFTALGLGRILAVDIGVDRTATQYLARRALSLRATAALCAALACVSFAWFEPSDSRLWLVLGAFAVALVARAVASLTDDLFLAHESARYSAQQELLFRPAELVAAVSVLALGGGIVALAWVHAAGWVLQAARGVSIVRSRITPLRPVWDPPGMLGLLRRGLPIGVGAFFTGWLLQGPLVLFRHSAHDPTQTGQFALVMQMLFVLVFVAWGFLASSLPVLSRSVARGDGKDRLYLDVAARGAWFLSVGLALIGAVCAPPVVGILFGDGFAEAGGIMGEALLLLAPLILGMAASTLLLARGQALALAFWSFAGCVILAAALPPLAARGGVAGGLLGVGLSVGSWALALTLSLARGGVGDPRRTLLWPMAVVGSALLVRWLSSLVMGELPAAALGVVVVVVGVGISLLPGERRALTDCANRLRGGGNRVS